MAGEMGPLIAAVAMAAARAFATVATVVAELMASSNEDGEDKGSKRTNGELQSGGGVANEDGNAGTLTSTLSEAGRLIMYWLSFGEDVADRGGVGENDAAAVGLDELEMLPEVVVAVAVAAETPVLC
jgi:hypothetical protein